MDVKDRKRILNNINELVRNTKYKELIDGCEETRLLSDIMRARIETLPDADEHTKHKELFIKLTKRGPEAYDILTELLMKLKFRVAANILKVPKLSESNYISMKGRNPNTTGAKEELNAPENLSHSLPEGCYPSKDSADGKDLLIPFTEEINPKPCFEVIKSKVIRYDQKVPYYRMSSKNRGVFFMVNIIEFPKRKDRMRSGASKDGQDLLYLFRELGFTCFPYNNLTGEKFFEIYHLLLKSDYLKQTESFVMALMSHGEMTDDMHDRVEFTDGSVFKVKDIEDLLSNESCPSLVNKPKILIFPFCRGQAPDVGVHQMQTDSIYMGPPCGSVIPTRSDMLVCYASVRGYQALRDPDVGAWYIQTFCKILAEHAHDTHLEDMLKLIGSEVRTFRSTEGYLQTPAYYNHGFNKQLFFNPGVIEE